MTEKLLVLFVCAPGQILEKTKRLTEQYKKNGWEVVVSQADDKLNGDGIYGSVLDDSPPLNGIE
jgi:hypothetical protein